MTTEVVIPQALTDRRNASAERFERLPHRIESALPECNLQNICIYATGSYGRGEGSLTSDIDLFMLDIADGGERLSNIDRIRLTAALVEACEQEEFPPFSNDGEYLVVHALDDIRAALGGRTDDAANYFTARLLLLLESRCIHNDTAYNFAMNAFVNTYFRDSFDHADDFVPGFLANDVVRFWKTLCLNYEHDRGLVFERLPEDEPLRRNWRLKNLKLKFSRLMTCYSALAPLALMDANRAVTPTAVLEVLGRSPTERIENLGAHDHLNDAACEVLEGYAWFLETLGTSKEAALAWLADNTAVARERANGYQRAFLSLLSKAGEGGQIVTRILM